MENRKKTHVGEIIVGMKVVDPRGIHVGDVKEIHEEHFLVDRPMTRDVYVPYDACLKIEYRELHLNVPAKEVGKQGWKKSSLF